MSQDNKNKPYSFWDKYISQTHVINLKRRPDRLQEITEKFDEYGIPFEAVEAIDGQQMEPEEYRHTRSPGKSGINSTKINLKKGVLGCHQSHLKVVRNALESVGTPESDSRFIAIMEDDAYALPELAPQVESALAQMPDDAMMVYLSAWHKVADGFFPISGNTKNHMIVKPTSALSTIAYLVNPKFLPVLEDVLDANAKAKGNTRTGEGGTYPIDMVYAALHTFLTLGRRPETDALDKLITVFEASCEREGIKHASIYAVNPLPFGQGLNYSDIATTGQIADYTSTLRTGKTLKALRAEQVSELTDMVAMAGDKSGVAEILEEFNASKAMGFDELKEELADYNARNPVQARNTGFTALG